MGCKTELAVDRKRWKWEFVWKRGRQKDSNRRGVMFESCTWISSQQRTFGRLKCARTHVRTHPRWQHLALVRLEWGPLGDRRSSSHHKSRIHAHTYTYTHLQTCICKYAKYHACIKWHKHSQFSVYFSVSKEWRTSWTLLVSCPWKVVITCWVKPFLIFFILHCQALFTPKLILSFSLSPQIELM